MQQGRSIGKKVLGLRVIYRLQDGSSCSLRQSIYRNLPFILPLSFAIIPFLGWLFSLFLLLALSSLELYLICKIDSGHRLGDVMADTTVITNDPHRAEQNKESWFKPEKSA